MHNQPTPINYAKKEFGPSFYFIFQFSLFKNYYFDSVEFLLDQIGSFIHLSLEFD